MDDRALMQMALDAFEAMISEGWSYCGPERTSKAQTACYEATLALRERLAQSEPEAVAWMKVWRDGTKNFYDHEPPMFGKHKTYALYTAPREWVGLTDQDIDLYAFDEGVTNNKAPAWLVTYARGIEAKLKEKNNAT